MNLLIVEHNVFKFIQMKEMFISFCVVHVLVFHPPYFTCYQRQPCFHTHESVFTLSSSQMKLLDVPVIMKVAPVFQ